MELFSSLDIFAILLVVLGSIGFTLIWFKKLKRKKFFFLSLLPTIPLSFFLIRMPVGDLSLKVIASANTYLFLFALLTLILQEFKKPLS